MIVGPTRLARGRAAEAIAAAYLELRGYLIAAANVRDGPRELDLVVEKDRLVVFVEVKFRAGDRFGGFRSALGHAQKMDLERAAVAFLKATGRTGRPVRFDFIGVEFTGDSGLSVVHLPAAYSASGRYSL
jgi:putative endonuclease